MQQRATATGAEAMAYNKELFVYRFIVSYKTGKKSKTFQEDQHDRNWTNTIENMVSP